MTPKNIYRAVAADSNGYRKVPMPIFMAVVGVMFTVICSLVAWTWGSSSERTKLAADLAFQFDKQAAIATKAYEEQNVTTSNRMDRIQGDVRELRDMLTRHIEMDKPGR